ncbi:two-component sensor histidine kinase [Sulfurimonas paralvinellae]|uniref:histidine kinase n=2 Tax=Sulfurimonas paralvinellae TaxID=317658 RepID=A0A7M1BAL7_9BACT|nr:two-component sensor histidine kinase [Sulfurimonas paralvinellae]
MSLRNIFVSGHQFQKDEIEQRSRFQMINIALITSSIAYIYGFIINHFSALAWFEFSLFVFNIIAFFLLRRSKQYYTFVSMSVTTIGTTLLILLIYVTDPTQMKFVWIYTYPIVMLYLVDDRVTIVWFLILIGMILIAPLQPYIPVKYSFFQVFYIVFALVIVSLIVYFYKYKMIESKRLILQQQEQLERQIKEMQKKDKMLTLQSRQAVMGEMISMIAHQWRQPLSTVTLNISNLQVKKLLGEEIPDTELDSALENISDTVVYLSETIDDFQTYFRPNKEIATVDINELVKKAISFIEPRLKKTRVEIRFNVKQRIVVATYQNELIQVLLNIINNAVDELVSRNIKNPHIGINIFSRHKEVVIEIADNAGGISQENIDSIFEPYFSTKGKNGTGLGLYMSQMIMLKQFHTEINVKSTRYGSVFTVVVPKKLA